jgi:hypothetical protein
MRVYTIWFTRSLNVITAFITAFNVINEAREFLLQEESYNTVRFPPYIKFKTLIDEINDKLEKSR